LAELLRRSAGSDVTWPTTTTTLSVGAGTARGQRWGRLVRTRQA
jgi:hypothetical protein